MTKSKTLFYEHEMTDHECQNKLNAIVND